jgi:hypothetical protein
LNWEKKLRAYSSIVAVRQKNLALYRQLGDARWPFAIYSEPLNEYVALGADITVISFHEDPQLVRLTFLLCWIFAYYMQLSPDKLLAVREVIGQHCQ